MRLAATTAGWLGTQTTLRGIYVNEPCVVDGNLVSGRTLHEATAAQTGSPPVAELARGRGHGTVDRRNWATHLRVTTGHLKVDGSGMCRPVSCDSRAAVISTTCNACSGVNRGS